MGVWTIGYGHIGPDVVDGLMITEAQADILLARDLERFERGVEDAVSVSLEQHEFDALVSFSYNLGLGALRGSTLLRLLNAGEREAAAAEFKRWNRAGGKILNGLVRRRRAEAVLFRGEGPA